MATNYTCDRCEQPIPRRNGYTKQMSSSLYEGVVNQDAVIITSNNKSPNFTVTVSVARRDGVNADLCNSCIVDILEGNYSVMRTANAIRPAQSALETSPIKDGGEGGITFSETE